MEVSLDISKITEAKRIRQVRLGAAPVTLEEFIAVARFGAKVSFSQEYLEQVTRSRQLAEKFLTENRKVYGLTTGFGDNVRKIIPQEQAVELQVNILRSHSVSVGEPLKKECVRAIWLMQLLSLGKGYSGIRPETLSLIAECLNNDVTPYVPQDGSVQYLAIEGQINLILMGEGRAWHNGRLMSGAEALAEIGQKPWTPAPKEGLCLTNGANAATGVSALALYDNLIAAQTADIAAAMAFEAFRGTILACDERLHSLKKHPEQANCAANIRTMLSDSAIMKKYIHAKVQDAYILRCIPQMHGASKRFIKDCAANILEEMASCSDNPVLFPEGGDGTALMGANFDSTFASGSADILCMAAANLAKFSERRTDRLTNRYLNQTYPAFLAERPGVDNCYMIVQYTAAALVGEIRSLSAPATADSVPTCANWEDPVSMGWWAARKSLMVAKKLHYVLGIELMAMTRAFDLLQKEEDGFASATKTVHDKIREVVPPVEKDRYFGPDIENTAALVSDGTIIETAEEIAGTLAL